MLVCRVVGRLMRLWKRQLVGKLLKKLVCVVFSRCLSAWFLYQF
jgi:hypothetical protein